MRRAEILDVERAGMDALPAPESVHVGGWTVMLGRGAVGRLNSAVTNGYRPRALLDQIVAVERRFAARTRPPSFRLTRLDATVDDLLDRRGYHHSPDVVVMVGPASGRAPEGVSLLPAVTPLFVSRYRDWGGHDEVRVDEIAESLGALALPHVVAMSDAAIAVGVLTRGRIGLFDVVVDPAARRRGHGRAVSRAVFAWGANQGAEQAFLQSHSDNAPAIGLYRSLGLGEGYRYWYRRRRTVPR